MTAVVHNDQIVAAYFWELETTQKFLDCLKDHVKPYCARMDIHRQIKLTNNAKILFSRIQDFIAAEN